jgi:hypothetical protein
MPARSFAYLRNFMKLNFLWVLLAGACYSYRPIPSGAQPPIGPQLQLQLTDEGRVAVKAMAGPGVDRVEGVLDSASGQSFVMRVSAVRRDGSNEHWTGEPLVIPVSTVSSVGIRRFDLLRTVGLGVGFVALASVVRFNGLDDIISGGKGSGGSTSGK